MADIVTREQFIEACPIDLKKRIDDFLVFYSQKKKTNAFQSAPETSKKFYKNDSSKYENKKNNMNSFRKPFDKAVSEFEKIFNDFKGTLSKINENNHESIWTEILELHLETFAVNVAVVDDGWSSVSGAKKGSSSVNTIQNSKDISLALYQYSRNCNMYLKQYVELIVRMRKSKDLVPFSNSYVDLVLVDLEKPKDDNRDYNVLTHGICCELFLNNLMTKKTFMDKCIVNTFDKINTNMEEDTPNDEHMEIMIQNMKKCGALISKTSEVSDIIDELREWKDNKAFSGKIHYNLIDLVEIMEAW
jgi:hypothetical protein